MLNKVHWFTAQHCSDKSFKNVINTEAITLIYAKNLTVKMTQLTQMLFNKLLLIH